MAGAGAVVGMHMVSGAAGADSGTADATAASELPDSVAADVYYLGGIAVRRYRPASPNGRPPVVMVHGGAHAGWAWVRYAGLLAAAGWECHALDWYHHGLSAALPVDRFIARGIPAVGAEIGIVSRALPRPPVLIGHSMGGLAVLSAAQQLSAHALVLVTPVVPAEVGADEIPIPVDLTQPFPVPPFEVAKAMFFGTMSDAEAAPYHNALQPESPQAVWEATRWTVSVDLDRITVPVMTVAAGADTLTPPEAVSGLAGLLGSTHVEVPNIGHSDVLLKSSGWQSVASSIEQWLRTV